VGGLGPSVTKNSAPSPPASACRLPGDARHEGASPLAQMPASFGEVGKLADRERLILVEGLLIAEHELTVVFVGIGDCPFPPTLPSSFPNLPRSQMPCKSQMPDSFKKSQSLPTVEEHEPGWILSLW